MICNECGLEREFIEEGACILCRRADKGGVEVFQEVNTNAPGLEIKSKYGRARENNAWMSKDS